MSQPHSGQQRAMPMIDTHCHVDLFQKPGDIIAQAEKLSIYTIAMTNVPSVFDETFRLVETSKFVRAAVGLHPELVVSHGKEIDLMWPLLDKTRYVGEVGLDYSTAGTSLRQSQKVIFTRILDRCATYKNKIISIHSRRSAGDVISSVGQNYPGIILMHWFSGTEKELKKGIEFGYYFSINPKMIANDSGRRLIAQIPRDRVLTESDAPFVKGKHGVIGPCTVEDTLNALAALWAVEKEQAGEIVMQNFRRILL